MEITKKALVLVIIASEIISAQIDPKQSLTVRIEDYITTRNCNETLENIQVRKLASTPTAHHLVVQTTLRRYFMKFISIFLPSYTNCSYLVIFIVER